MIRSSPQDSAEQSAATISWPRSSPRWCRRTMHAFAAPAPSVTKLAHASRSRCSRKTTPDGRRRPMKVTGRNIESFLRDVDAAVAAVLLYGPDAGLVRERADRLTALVAGDATDPFRVSEVTPDRLRDQPSLLSDEAAALTFGGGRRVVRLRNAGDGQSVAVQSFLRAPAGDGLLIVEADELGPRSSLRQLFEAAGNAAALPCYRDETGDLAR